jgi:hypothetical protein
MFTKEVSGSLSDRAWRFLVGLAINADREGRLQDRPFEFIKTVFPYQTLSVEDVEAVLKELQSTTITVGEEKEASPLIQRYKAARSREYSYKGPAIQILGWHDPESPTYQYINRKTESKESAIAPPPNYEVQPRGESASGRNQQPHSRGFATASDPAQSDKFENS